MKTEKVSIVVPVFNAEKTIKRCIESLLQQTYQNIQIIVINDGSKDQSLKICQEYQFQDPRIDVITHENRGVSYTRNKGIKHATGKYLMFVDSDDYVEPNMIEKYIEAMMQNKADVVIGGIHFLNENKGNYDKVPSVVGELQKREFWKALCAEDNSIWGYVPNKMYKTQIIKKYNLIFNENMKAQEDLAFALDYFATIEKFYVINYCGYNYEYAIVQRNVPAKDLIGNQQKILLNAKKVGVEAVIYEMIIRKIQKQIYTSLYYCESIDEISSIMNMPKLIENVRNVSNLKGEEKKILSWFATRKAKRIWIYFRIRNSLRKVLKRN